MDKYEALEKIEQDWNNNSLSLKDKIINISSNFYGQGLDLASTAAFIHATPSELYALIELSNLSDEMIDFISENNPPKITWQLLANASDTEIKEGIRFISENKASLKLDKHPKTLSDLVYQHMIEVSDPTPEQEVAKLSGEDLFHIWEKQKSYKALSEWETKFLASVAGTRSKSKDLTHKQSAKLLTVLQTCVDKGVIAKDSIDGDAEICNRILKALGK